MDAAQPPATLGAMSADVRPFGSPSADFGAHILATLPSDFGLLSIDPPPGPSGRHLALTPRSFPNHAAPLSELPAHRHAGCYAPNAPRVPGRARPSSVLTACPRARSEFGRHRPMLETNLQPPPSTCEGFVPERVLSSTVSASEAHQAQRARGARARRLRVRWHRRRRHLGRERPPRQHRGAGVAPHASRGSRRARAHGDGRPWGEVGGAGLGGRGGEGLAMPWRAPHSSDTSLRGRGGACAAHAGRAQRARRWGHRGCTLCGVGVRGRLRS